MALDDVSAGVQMQRNAILINRVHAQCKLIPIIFSRIGMRRLSHEQ